jgi:amidophosphoribosyltransferase
MKELAHLEGKPRCHCGVFGVFGHPDASVFCYYGLHALQHRGQEAAGIVSSEVLDESVIGEAEQRHKKKRRFNIQKGIGLVADVFKDEDVLRNGLKGSAAIGHNRYSTTGSSDNKSNIQPFVVNYKTGNLALSHNGNLTNYRILRHRLQEEGTIFQSTSDSEIILHLIAHSKQKEQILQIKEALDAVEGAYSLVILTDESLIAARDPHGFRPLALGKLDGAYVVASETCAFDINGAEYIRDIAPGEIIVIDKDVVASGTIKSHWVSKKSSQPHHCIFEYIYFARPDSKVFGVNVDKVRRKLGKLLASENPIVPESPDDKVIVISVPDSSNTCTLGYVTESNKQGLKVKLELGLIRNHYIGRTFIQPQENHRELKVKLKFNTVKGVLKGKKVIIVDDSIVRGTTSKLLVKMIREAEPKEVHFRISSPPIKYPCYYGMDFPSREELIANRLNGDIEAIRQELGVDSLSYLPMEKLLESVPTDEGKHYCTACFSGNYSVPIDTESVKNENDQ